METSGNKGEWSEVYALFKLLADGELSSGDADLNKIEELIYPIISIIRDNVVYDCNGRESNIIIKTADGETLGVVSASEFKAQAELLLQRVRKGTGAFEVPEIVDFREKTHVENIKAPSAQKADIVIVVHDERTGADPALGFSIKSQLGSPSTLLNASRTTNFIYRFSQPISPEKVEFINGISSQIRRMELIDREKIVLEYAGIEPSKLRGNIFECNLINIDSSLPQILAYLILYYYKYGLMTVRELTDKLTKLNPLHYDQEFDHKYYEVKMKRLLMDAALGMTPTKVWNGRYEANGGYLVVREDGEIVCYHIYNKNEFEDYLFNNTKIDMPSRTRHDYGYIYREGDDEFIKLNFQIRFIK
jgi:type II restriction enzyme